MTYKCCNGSLEFLDVFACFRSCHFRCIDYSQPCFDILGIIIDALLVVGVLALGCFLAVKFIKGGNVAPIVLIFLISLGLVAMLAINIIRFKRNIKVKATVRDIVQSYEMSMKDDVKRIVLDNLVGKSRCKDYPIGRCSNTDPMHRVKCHERDEVFKLSSFSPEGKNNIVIGYHQTTIDAMKSIIQTEMKASSKGWLGKGIYFANNMEATFTKANSVG